jgi:small subunit ribosomal protein S8
MDTIGDFLTRVRNALAARHKYVDVPASNLKLAMGEILREQGYIESVEKMEDDKQGVIRVTLKYTNGAPAIMGLKRISTPGLRHIHLPCKRRVCFQGSVSQSFRPRKD